MAKERLGEERYVPLLSFFITPPFTSWEQHPIYVYLSNTSDRIPAEPVRRSYDTGSFGTYARPTAPPKGS
jgi:hypothetical protein